MKRILFFLFVLAILPLEELAAQAHIRSGFGLKAGASVSNFRGGDSDFSANWGPMGGIYGRIGISDFFTLQPELLYSMQGARFNGQQQNQIVDRLSYINLPILGQFWLAPGFNVHIGPYAGVLLDVWTQGRADVDVAADYLGWDWGGAAGLEYELPFGLNFGVRYNIGLRNIVNQPTNLAPNVAAPGRQGNHFGQIYLGWTISN
jgi:hypothetical protein